MVDFCFIMLLIYRYRSAGAMRLIIRRDEIYQLRRQECFRACVRETSLYMSSKELAKLIGPTISVMSISEMVNMRIWVTNNPAITYLNGIILFVAGLSIIRVHNLWSFRWPVVVTILAWGAVAAGLFRMFFPGARQGGQNVFTYMLTAILLTAGIFISYKGYVRGSDR